MGDDRWLRPLVRIVIGLGAAVVIGTSPWLTTPPAAWKLALAAGIFVLGDIALLHIRFGHDQYSFTWSETAVVLGLVLLPEPWLVVVAPLAVAIAHTVARRPAMKVAFNAMSFATGALLARDVFSVLGGINGELPVSTAEWLALPAASLVFFAWNFSTVSAAVAFSQGLPFRTVFGKGAPLNALVWLGNTTVGVALVYFAQSNPADLLVIPVLLAMLYGVYWSYLRAMRERDLWKVLQTTSRDLLLVEPTELAKVIVDRVPTLFGAEFVELMLVDAEQGARATVYRSEGTQPMRTIVDHPLQVAGTFWGRVLCDREPFEVRTTSATAAQRTELDSLGLRMCVVAPLLAQERCLGTLRIGFRGEVAFGAREIQVFTTFANHASAAVHNARLFEEIRDQALHDPLTGLANRTLLLNRMEQAQARSERTRGNVAVLFLDLDRFKVVNDSLGHEVGDELLVAVAARITSSLRPGDTAARFGGDEFVVLCDEVDSPRQALEIAERLAAKLEPPFMLRGEMLFLTASVGVAVAETAQDDPMAMLRDADAAMYQSKAKGPARAAVFDRAMRARLVDRLELENDLRRAIERGELRVHYQPIQDMESGRLVAAEALVRWQHAERGLVSPCDFIALAEETGLVNPLGAWVVDEACRQLAMWGRAGMQEGEAPLSVSVNLSPHQLSSPDLVSIVATALNRWRVGPDRLCLEITEGALVDDVDGAIQVLRRLKALGVRIALDDFGTGYSSLGYLHLLPVDVVKLDKSFIERMNSDERDRAIVAGMIELAHALDLEVVAEGVETALQREALSALGCDLVQGFLVAPALTAEDIEVHLGLTHRHLTPVPGGLDEELIELVANA